MLNPEMVLTVIFHKIVIILTILAGVKLLKYLKILGKNLMQLIIKCFAEARENGGFEG